MALTEDEVRGYMEKLHAIRNLEQLPEWGVYREEMKRQLGAWQRRMNSGQITDIMEYKYVSGVIHGMGLFFEIKERLEDLIEESWEEARASQE
jgi:hypothetical protein